MFIGHGKHQVSIQGDIICIKLIGAFNEYDFQAISAKVKAQVSALDGRAFCMLIDHSELLGATPEAYQELDKLNTWLNEQNMRAKAIVINLSTVLDTIKSRTPAISTQNIKVFECVNSARQWLDAFAQQ